MFPSLWDILFKHQKLWHTAYAPFCLVYSYQTMLLRRTTRALPQRYRCHALLFIWLLYYLYFLHFVCRHTAGGHWPLGSLRRSSAAARHGYGSRHLLHTSTSTTVRCNGHLSACGVQWRVCAHVCANSLPRGFHTAAGERDAWPV